jgi:aconitase B
MLYDVTKIAKKLNTSKVTVYAKLKLEEIKPLIIRKNGKAYVDDDGLESIKQSLKYNQSNTAEEESAATVEIELLKDDMIETLKTNIGFLIAQLNIKDDQLLSKDGQIKGINQLFENTQILFKQEQEKSITFLALPEVIKEHDIELVETLTATMKKQKEIFLKEEQNQKKGFLKKIFSGKK